MTGLSETQLQDLTAHIRGSIRRYDALEEELIDHLACIVEEDLAAGLDYPSARQHALELLNKDEVKKTEGNTLYFVHTKPVLMKCFLLLGLSGMTALFFWLTQPIIESVEDRAAHLPITDSANVGLLSDSLELSLFATTFASPGHKPLPTPIDPPAIAPLGEQYEVSSGFGMRMHPIFKEKKWHRGIDFKAPHGTPVVATADGIIRFAEKDGAYGLKVIIEHDGQYKSLYAHLSAIKVTAGDRITKGTVIGLVGNTGKSMAPHLHYEVVKDGKPVDPANYLPRS